MERLLDVFADDGLERVLARSSDEFGPVRGLDLVAPQRDQERSTMRIVVRPAAHPLELVSATTAATGVLICTYRPAYRGPSSARRRAKQLVAPVALTMLA